jgi:peptide/nickel transport system permease protein
VAILVFAVLRLLPGDRLTAQLGTQAGILTPTQRTALESYYALDEPVWSQFTSWLGSVVQGNLGVSLASGQPVDQLVLDALPVTLELAVLATLIGGVAGVALGVLSATKPGSARDMGVQALGLLGLGIPNFVIASALVAILAAWFSYFPDAGAYISPTESLSGNLGQMIYPALTLAVLLAATVMRTTRSAYLEVASMDFVRTAHGKGLAPQRVRLHHVLRNASVPIVTIIGIQFGYLLGGTVIVEQVFALPGLGRLVLTGILQRDYPVVQSTVLLIAVGFVLVNLLVDLLYARLDPRVRYT